MIERLLVSCGLLLVWGCTPTGNKADVGSSVLDRSNITHGSTQHSLISGMFKRILPHKGSEADFSHLHAVVKKHPVAGLGALAKYDPSGALGFCFGRAMAVHLSALRLGVDDVDVKKLLLLEISDLGRTPNGDFT
jgi:hypothetical protein